MMRPLVALLLFGALLASGAGVPQVGQPAPDFDLKTLDGAARALPISVEIQLPFPVALDAKGKVRRRYGLAGLPMTVFVDSAGIVRAVHPGPMTTETLNRGLAAILPAP